MKMHWAVKLAENQSADEVADELTQIVAEELKKGVPRGMSQLAYLKRTGQAFGPFQKHSHAIAMAPSDVDDAGRDFYGEHWAFIELPMIYREFEEPIWTVKKYFVCSKSDARTSTEGCDSFQRFPGSCSKCKADGEALVATVQIRDWAGRYD